MKTISILLCALLVITPAQIKAVPPAKPGETHFLYALCIIGGAAILGGVAYFTVKSCKPKYYCVVDEDGNSFPSNASRTQRAAEGWKVKSGPYTSAEEAAAICPPKTNAPGAQTFSALLVTNSPVALVDEVYIPSLAMSVWKTTNSVDWVKVASLRDDPDHFTWTDTNAVSAAAFYRVSLP